jgi:hypothetical protein
MGLPCCLIVYVSPLTPESSLSLLGSNSLNTFPAATNTYVGRIVFYAVRVVSKVSRRFIVMHYLTQTHDEVSYPKVLHLFRLYSEWRNTHYKI